MGLKELKTLTHPAIYKKVLASKYGIKS